MVTFQVCILLCHLQMLLMFFSPFESVEGLSGVSVYFGQRASVSIRGHLPVFSHCPKIRDHPSRCPWLPTAASLPLLPAYSVPHPGHCHVSLPKRPQYLTCSQPYPLPPPSPAAPSVPLPSFTPPPLVAESLVLWSPCLGCPSNGPLSPSWLSFPHLFLCSCLLLWLSLPQRQLVARALPQEVTKPLPCASPSLSQYLGQMSPCLSLLSSTLIISHLQSFLSTHPKPNFWFNLLKRSLSPNCRSL